MKINLSQAEITQAVRNYVVEQGINLAGKNVSVDYTATRSGAGITADITIEPAETIPGFSGSADTSTVSVNETKAEAKVEAEVRPIRSVSDIAKAAQDVILPEDVQPEPADAAPAAKAQSIFS